jgi:hypothetical protein
MRFLTILSAAALLAAPAFAQSGPDKAKSPDALHSEQLAKEASE